MMALTPEELILVSTVRDRINAKQAASGDVDVTFDEEDACRKAVLINLKERGLPPIPYCNKQGHLMFRNFGLVVPF